MIEPGPVWGSRSNRGRARTNHVGCSTRSFTSSTPPVESGALCRVPVSFLVALEEVVFRRRKSMLCAEVTRVESRSGEVPG